ncbi:MAG: hypothetical protein KDC32_07870, partial [Saprospiraceae bacterium]|nr:hypothetical protein [Saprospiraceae bacterium]
MKKELLLIGLLILAACRLNAQEDLDGTIDRLLSRMTLEEKIGQMTQLNITTIVQDSILEDYANVTHYVIDTV